MFRRVADLTWQHPRKVLAAVGLFAVLAGVFGGSVDRHLKAAGFDDPASESTIASERLISELGYDPAPGIVVLVRARGDGAFDARSATVRDEVRRLSRELDAIPAVARVTAPVVASDGSSLIVSGHLDTDDDEVRGDAATAARARLDSERFDVQIGGFATAFNDVNDTVREDLIRAELIAFPVLMVLLLIVFRGLVAAFIPLMIGGLAILGTFLALRVMALFVDTSIFALNIATALGLGLAVDYGLLMVSRYREEIERDGATQEAHRRTVETAGRTVVFSGLTVAAALAALIVLPQRFLYSMGAGGAIVAMLAALMAFLTVPALLALLGQRINALSIRRGPAVSDTSGAWYRLAKAVMRRPVPIVLASAAVLLAASAPVLGAHWTGPTAETVPHGLESRTVSDVLASDYPPEVELPVAVVVDGQASDAELARLGDRISGLDGIGSGGTFRRASDGLAQATFGPDGDALGDRVQEAVREIRATELPQADVLVTGNTANFIDLKASLLGNAPLVAGLIATTTLILLFLLTGSVILPFKTLLMNVLTLTATLGVVIVGFQHGVLHELTSFDGPSAAEVSMVVVLFAVTFGLATDYAVLVMARIKEFHDAGMSNEEAVATGIARTGRVITAAAVLLAVVFLAFATGRIFFMKEVGIGQAAAVLIDATIVRALLVPALMRLFGEWNWWAPRRLRAISARTAEQHG